MALGATVSGCLPLAARAPERADSREAVCEFAVEPALLGTPRSVVVEQLGEPDSRRSQGPHEVEVYEWRAVAGRQLARASATHLRVEDRSLPILDGTRLMLQYSKKGVVTGYALSAVGP